MSKIITEKTYVTWHRTAVTWLGCSLFLTALQYDRGRPQTERERGVCSETGKRGYKGCIGSDSDRLDARRREDDCKHLREFQIRTNHVFHLFPFLPWWMRSVSVRFQNYPESQALGCESATDDSYLEIMPSNEVSGSPVKEAGGPP